MLRGHVLVVDDETSILNTLKKALSLEGYQVDLAGGIRIAEERLAKQSYDLLLGDKGGLARDLAPDSAGMRTVLRLRSKYGSPQKTLTDPMKYVDLSYYEKAFGKH